MTLTNGGAADTILGSHTLTIDGATQTVTLDGGGWRSFPRGFPVWMLDRFLQRPGDGHQGYGRNPSEEASSAGAKGKEGEENYQGIATGQERSIHSALDGEGRVVVDRTAGPGDAQEIDQGAQDGQEVGDEAPNHAPFGFCWRFGLLAHLATGINS